MNRLKELVIGIDVGTTSVKARAHTLEGDVVGQAQAPTPWTVENNGYTQIDVDSLADCAIRVMVDAIPVEHPHGSVMGIGITGMAETGVLLDSRLRPVMPAIAWYDERGKSELETLTSELSRSFSATTGLAYKAECSFSKVLWRQQQGNAVPDGARWLNALEYIAFRLTGRIATEPSLASRTGFMNQSNMEPWEVTLDIVGAKSSLIPNLLNAGTALGNVLESGPRQLRGAAVTVAGHDHLVGAIGAGAYGVNDLYNSCGTADVMLRSVARTLTNQERATLVDLGLSAGRHVLPGATAVLGATRSGLVLGRIFSMLGIDEREGRQALAATWREESRFSGDVTVTEPPAWTNELVISLKSDVTPNDLWQAAFDYTLRSTRELLTAIESVAGSYDNAIAAGGWSRIDGVLLGKSSIIPGIHRFDGEEPGTRGAAAIACLAAEQLDVPLVADMATRFVSHSPKELVS